jgi:deoxyribonuclease-1-like protein
MRLFYSRLLLFISFLLLTACTSRSKKQSDRNVPDSPEIHNANNENKISPEGLSENGDLIIASWNIQDLGRTKDRLELVQIAQIIKDFDVVALQEVVAKDPAGVQAVARIADELNRMGSKWDYSVSAATNSPSSYISERYAFLWKTSKVKLVKRPYLDKELEVLCNREPYIASFKVNKGQKTFFIINYHSRKHEDHPEEEIIHFKEYPNRLKSDRLFIVGDFNLNEEHKVWNPLYKLGFQPSLKNTPTTLKIKCRYDSYLNHSIDNIYYNTSNIELINAGRIDFVHDCGNLKNARHLSDHLPVFLEFSLF